MFKLYLSDLTKEAKDRFIEWIDVNEDDLDEKEPIMVFEKQVD